MKRILSSKKIIISIDILYLLISFCSPSDSLSQEFYYDIVFDDTSLMISDIAIDRQNNFYILDDSKNKVYVFNKNGKWIKDIRLLDVQYDNETIKHPSRNIGLDKENNLYCLSKAIEFFISIDKFDSNGSHVKRFAKGENIPERGENMRHFYVSKNGTIYLNTFRMIRPPAFQTPVYVYDSQGNFLGKVDYYIEDLEGNVYKFNKLQKNISILNKYQKIANKPTKQLTRLSENRFTESSGYIIGHGHVFTFLGFDGENNMYVTNGKVTKKLGKNLQELQEIQTPLAMLESDGIYCNQNDIRVGYDGTLYFFGSKREKDTYKKLSSVLIRIKR